MATKTFSQSDSAVKGWYAAISRPVHLIDVIEPMVAPPSASCADRHLCSQPAWAVVSDESHPLLGGYPAPFGRPFDEFYTGRDGGRYPTRKECREGGKGFLGGTGHDPWNQVAAEASAAWEGFWANTNGTNDAWAAMWAHVAQHFRGDASILGLELLNEPFAGDPFHHPLIFLPPPARHNADHTRLQPGYDRANAAIRAVDDERLLFFAGVT